MKPDSGHSFGSWNPVVTAALLSAAVTLGLAGLLPFRFSARPNPLGIVSATTLSGYATQQETFWLVYGVAVGGLVAWWLASLLHRQAPPVPVQVGLEALSAGTLFAMLMLPAGLREVVVVVGVSSCLWWAGRSPGAAAPSVVSAAGRSSRSASQIGWQIALALSILLVAFLRPRFWLSAWNVAHGTPDLDLASDDWGFHAELGQHLAWADALRTGGWPGLDYFSLYGPLVTLGLVTTWELLGRSIAATTFFFELVSALGAVAAMSLAAWHLHRPALALLVPFIALPIRGRYGLGLFGLLLFSGAIRSRRALPMFCAGFSAGFVLFYSQEFGLALLLCAGTGLAIAGDARTRLLFLAGLVSIGIAVLSWLHLGGALGPTLRDLTEYPGLVIAGFGKLPFPAILSALPLDLTAGFTGRTIPLRLGYATVTIYVVALLLILRVDRMRPRSLPADLRGLAGALRADPARLCLALVALFGLVAFRSAMGRSEIINLVQASGCAGILLVVAFDRTLDWMHVPIARWLAGWRIAALFALAWLGGFLPYSGAVFVRSASDTADALGALASGSYVPRGDPAIARLIEWIRQQNLEDGGILFLPNQAAYYYLTDRRSPLRFVLGHQIVTDAHREESLRRLQADPPRFILWSPHSMILDGIPHETYLGDPLMRWIREEYTPLRALDHTTVFEWRAQPDARRDG